MSDTQEEARSDDPSPPVKSPGRSARSNGKHYSVVIYEAWCKRCGICAEFCPKKALVQGEFGKIDIHDDHCTGCLMCLVRCPDFAVTVSERREDPGAVQ